MKKTVLIVSALIIAGCSQIQPVKLPEVELASKWRTGPTVESNGTSWWKVFGDTTLDHLESLALAENLDIKQAEARIEQARASAGIAEAALAPAIVLDGSVGRVQQSLNTGLGTLSNVVPHYKRTLNPSKISFSGAWDLDFAGSLKSQREAAGATVLASSAELQVMRLAISAEVADAYVMLLGTRQQKAALVHQLNLLASQKQIMAVRVRVGTASQEALHHLNATIEQVTAPLAILDATISGQKDRLALLVGRNPSSWEFEIENTKPVPTAVDPTGGVPVAVLSRRPDVLAAEHRVRVAGANVSAAMAEYYPRISLAAALGQDTSNYSNINASNSTFAQTFLGLRWRLFDFGRIDSEVKVAKGKQKEVLLAYRAAVLRAASDVETAFTQLAATRERLQHLEEEGKSARLVAQSVHSALKAGATSQDDAINAERNVARSDFDVMSAHRDLARAIIVAARALGGPIEISDYVPAMVSN
jgi:NodT family efflux transporter outer membrane factor (OMF) lipoprotein